MTHQHAGRIVEDDAQDGFGRAVVRADGRSVHEVADPQVIDIVHLEDIGDVDAFCGCKPSLSFHDSEQGVIVARGLTEQTLVSQVFMVQTLTFRRP